MSNKLPKSLAHEPLIDALFEIRLEGSPSLADLLPGILFHQLSPKSELVRLPAAEIPQPMRTQDPNLQFAPTLRLDWKEYSISIGDRNIIVNCQMPYPKWPAFKAAILEIVKHINEIGLTNTVTRYSLKYTNILPGLSYTDQVSKISMSVQLGRESVPPHQISLQIHHKVADTIHITSVVTGAEARLSNGNIVRGIVLDIDSIRDNLNLEFTQFAADLQNQIESLRQANKEKFFDCLTDSAIDEMEPTYE